MDSCKALSRDSVSGSCGMGESFRACANPAQPTAVLFPARSCLDHVLRSRRRLLSCGLLGSRLLRRGFLSSGLLGGGLLRRGLLSRRFLSRLLRGTTIGSLLGATLGE